MKMLRAHLLWIDRARRPKDLGSPSNGPKRKRRGKYRTQQQQWVGRYVVCEVARTTYYLAYSRMTTADNEKERKCKTDRRKMERLEDAKERK